jgi:hypothetical protein
MRKRKLQIFLSSTYEDLSDQRLTAMEAILAAGHIPAAMEQFAPGDETAWEKITAWIDESDAFILILGGRYGSIEPKSGKSYVQLEYEYVVEKKKPFFALVVGDTHHEQRLREFGSRVDEREHQQKYKEFKGIVKQRLCGFWNDKKDIKAAIFQKLPEWAQRADLTGWVRSDEAADPEVTNELARLSQENSELRAKTAAITETFEGLTVDEFLRMLEKHPFPVAEAEGFLEVTMGKARSSGRITLRDLFRVATEAILSGGTMQTTRAKRVMDALAGFGLVREERQTGNMSAYTLTEIGRRLRNRLLAEGRWDRELK